VRVLLRGARFPASRFFSARVRQLPDRVGRVRRFVPASVAPCIPPDRPRRARVRLGLALVYLRRDRFVRAAVRERLRGVPDSATFPGV
jgi:hypothetical protein